MLFLDPDPMRSGTSCLADNPLALQNFTSSRARAALLAVSR